MKIFKKILLYLSLIIGVLLISATISIYLFQDRLINLAIKEMNKVISTPIKTKEVEVSLWQQFPNITLSFHQIEIKESIRNQQSPLAKLEKLHLGFNLFQLIKGNYVIDQLFLHNGEVTIRYTKEGLANFEIIKKDKERSDTVSLSLNLRAINAKNVKVNYVDERRKQTYEIFVQQATAKLNLNKGIYDIPIEGELISERIMLEEYAYFQNKQVNINGKITYNENTELVIFEPSKLQFGSGKFKLQGEYDIIKSHIDLTVVGEDTKFETVLSFLPEQHANYFSPYKSKGDLYFNSSIKGFITEKQNPQILVQFGSKNSSFYHPDYQLRLENTAFEGSYTNGASQSMLSSVISLNPFSTTVDGRNISAELSISDFIDQKLSGKFSGKATFERLYGLLGQNYLEDISGEVDFDFKINGRLSDFETAKTINKVQTSGNLNAKDISFKVKDYELPFSNLQGQFIFNKSDLGISSFKGQIGNSEFHLQGLFLNAISYLLFDDQALAMDADLKSGFIDMDELLSGNRQDKNQTVEGQQAYQFHIPDNLSIRFRSQLGQVKFRRFRGKDISGEFLLRNQTLTANNLKAKVGGGTISIDGTVNAKKDNFMEVISTSHYEKIHVDSIFYVFEDFDQDWLTHKHLKGQIVADVSSSMVFDNKLNFDYDKFKATIAATILNGQMNNFAPMQSLSRFVEEDELANLRFSEMKNEILIENRTIFLPEMEIKSNVSNIIVNGQHTFDHRIDYRLVVPLKTMGKKDKDETFGAIEEDGRGGGSLYLAIIGTTDDYKITWDSKRSVRQLGQGLKSEKEQLKKALNKEQTNKKSEVKLSDDEFFDF